MNNKIFYRLFKYCSICPNPLCILFTVMFTIICHASLIIMLIQEKSDLWYLYFDILTIPVSIFISFLLSYALEKSMTKDLKKTKETNKCNEYLKMYIYLVVFSVSSFRVILSITQHMHWHCIDKELFIMQILFTLLMPTLILMFIIITIAIFCGIAIFYYYLNNLILTEVEKITGIERND